MTEFDPTQLTDEQLDIAIEWATRADLAYRAREDTVDGFAAFYEIIFDRKPPEHVVGWIDRIYQAKQDDKFILIEAFRGATKSTTAQAYFAFKIGINPERSNLIIGAGDSDAVEIAQQVADIIEHNEGWKQVFPEIVPDKRKWGISSGFEVMDESIPYEKWRAIRQADGKAPTLIGIGYKSKYIPGPHPTGVLMVDDIHNEENTLSDRELQKTKSIYTGTVVPMIEPTTTHIVIGTPWTFADVIAHCRGSEEYEHIYTPAYKEDGSPTWPEKWDKEQLEKRRRQVNNDIEFARMYELDLEKTKGLTLKREWLQPTWPHAEINDDWPVYLGVDFTSTEDPLKRTGDYFAMAVGRAIPGGKGMVIEDGIRQRVSQAEAEDVVVSWAARYPTLQVVGIEAIITGKMFYQNLLTNAELRSSNVILMPLSGGEFSKSKGYRFEKLMAPLFQRNRVYISDNAESDFIKQFVNEWMNWQGDRMESQYHNDTLDAVFATLKVAEPYVTPIGSYRRSGNNPFYPQQKKKNPFASLGVK